MALPGSINFRRRRLLRFFNISTNQTKICVQPVSEGDQSYAFAWAKARDYPLKTIDPDIIIWVSESQGLFLSSPGQNPKARLSISFHAGSSNHRRKFGGGKSQMIARAAGIEPGISPAILDATAGLGGDSFVFACLGAEVAAIERSPILAEMLARAKEQALVFADDRDLDLQAALNRLSFIRADALDVLAAENGPPAEVVYLDPMFPERKKSSSVKKEMLILQKLLESEEQNEELLLEAALAKASHRVVVKRPRHAPHIVGQKPQYSLEGKSTRFDIYPLKSLRGSGSK